jgi:hypothetical protein
MGKHKKCGNEIAHMEVSVFRYITLRRNPDGREYRIESRFKFVPGIVVFDI